MNHIFSPSSSEAIPQVKIIGGKARNLAILSREGLPVPPWVVLTTEFFEKFLSDKLTDLIKLLSVSYASQEALKEASEKMEVLIKTAEFSPSMKAEIKEKILELSKGQHPVFFSVRSSATDEDSGEFSFAGQLESFLYVRDDEGLFASIKNCFASAYNFRVMSYRHANRLPLLSVRPAVILQKMIFGEVSGVLFTGNPLNNNPDQTVINAAFGIGEGIVSGELDSDLLVYDEHLKLIKRHIVEKEHELSFDAVKGAGTIKKNLDPALKNKEALSESEALDLVKMGKKLEKIFEGIPQDMEWCMEKGKLYLLQSRPITTLGHISKKEARTIYDNSNIIESYSGVTSPLTYSFADSGFGPVYYAFLKTMGTPVKKLKKHMEIFRNMIGYINGRLYYNLVSWYTTLILLPGYKYNRRFMEKMMGVKSEVNIEKDAPSKFFRRIFVDSFVWLKGIYKLVYNLLFIRKHIRKFIRTFYRIMDRYMEEKFETWTNRELINLHLYLMDEILETWKTPIINDFGTMVFYGLLSDRIKKFKIPGGDTLQNDLLAGEGELESTKPTREIIRISNWIREREDIKQLFLDNSEEFLIALLLEKAEPHYQEITALLRQYIKDYGFRAINEMKLEESTIKEDPKFLFTTLKNYLKKDAIDLDAMAAHEKEIRIKAEKIAKKHVPFFKKPVFRRILKRTRFHIKNREELRFMRTKLFGVVRGIFNAIGRNFTRDGLIATPKDIYFLTIPEVFELIEGRSVNLGMVKELIETRRANVEHYKTIDTPERMYYYGDIYKSGYSSILSDQELELLAANTDPNKLQGVPCSPGVVEGVAKIVLSPDDADLNGEILVTKRTDPGWVPLFPSISGLLIERGSVLSHSAVVAREMGIPTIVGLRKVTENIANGEKIRLDGSTGIVEKLG